MERVRRDALRVGDESIAQRVRPLGAVPATGDAILAIEAVPERSDLKRSVLASLAAALAPGTPIATNTSSLSVTDLAGAVPQPDRVLGLHFFNPPAAMKLVEVVRAELTSDAVLDAALAFVGRIGKTAVVTEDTPGFIVNRVARPFYLQSMRALDRGVATVAELDALARGAGFRMGPFELMDLIGLDVNLATSESVYERTARRAARAARDAARDGRSRAVGPKGGRRRVLRIPRRRLRALHTRTARSRRERRAVRANRRHRLRQRRRGARRTLGSPLRSRATRRARRLARRTGRGRDDRDRRGRRSLRSRRRRRESGRAARSGDRDSRRRLRDRARSVRRADASSRASDRLRSSGVARGAKRRRGGRLRRGFRRRRSHSRKSFSARSTGPSCSSKTFRVCSWVERSDPS